MRCTEDYRAKGIMSAVGALPTCWPSTNIDTDVKRAVLVEGQHAS
jgi:hypothetical protein